MKLRIQADTLRLRLTQSEVQQFATTGNVEEVISFGVTAGQQLIYALTQKADIDVPELTFSLNRLTVWVPTALASAWTATDQVGFSQDIPLEDGRTLGVLVEKDFACLHRQPGDDAPDAYPHPEAQKHKKE